MRALISFTAVCLAFLPLTSEAQGDYENGTIVSVAPHAPSPANNNGADVPQYDISVRIRETVYTALYTPRDGMQSIEYAAGLERLFLVSDTVLRCSTLGGGWTDMPILARKSVPSGPVIDWSKAPGQYFEMKMRNLTERLNLSQEQQVRIKPIIQQERGEVGAVCFTPTIPRKERLQRFEKIVRSSDEKLRPILSSNQWEQLEKLRKVQTEELKQFIAKEAHK